MTTEKHISEVTGLKPVLTFEQLQAKYESLEPKLPDNPNKATLTWNSMAVQQFVGIAAENNDRERDQQLLNERQNMIKTIASQNGFTPQDVHNAMHVLDPYTHHIPHFDIGDDMDDDDEDNGGHPPYVPPDNPPKFQGPGLSFTSAPKPHEWDWFSQTPRGGPPPPPGMGSTSSTSFHTSQTTQTDSSTGPKPPPPPPPAVSTHTHYHPADPSLPFLANHLILQGQHLQRLHQGMASMTMEQLRLAQQQAHREEQHQRVMREFTQQTQSMTNRLLERTSQTSQEQQQVLRSHIAELTAASKRIQEAAERNASIPPSLYSEHKRTQELVQQLLQQPPAQTPGVESLTGTLTDLVSTVSQGFQTLQQNQQQQQQQGSSIQAQIGVATNALHGQSHELKDLLNTLKAATQLLAVQQAQQAAGMDDLAGQLGAHLGQQAAAAQLQVEFSAKVLEELRAKKGANISIQQIAQILVANNVQNTPENIQHALEYLQDGSTATSSTGVAGPPPQPKAPLQTMGVGGMSKKEEQASSAPLIRMDPQGLPIGHNIHDEGLIAGATLATPKIIAAKTVKRMPLKYHRTWGRLATAVMKKKITAEQAVETLRRLRKQHIKKTQPAEQEEHEPTDDEGDNEAPMVPVVKRAKSPEAAEGSKRFKNKSRSPSYALPDAPPPPPPWYPKPPPGKPPTPSKKPPVPSKAPPVPSRAPSRTLSQPASVLRPSRAPPPRPTQRPPQPSRAPSAPQRGRSLSKSRR
jgi:hypothetical protein